MTQPTDPRPDFTLTRSLPASVERVWAAWTDPDAFHAWLAGMGTPRDTVHTDVRVGGRYGYTMVDASSGNRFPTGGRYLEVDELQLLRLTWGDPDEAEGMTAEITVRLAADGRSTDLRFDFRGMQGVDGVRAGWEHALGLLEQSLA